MFDSPGQVVKVQVLGPVEVLAGAHRLRLSRLQRHLVAAMAAESGRVVSVDVLCEALWGVDQPRDGRNRVQALVSSLRRLLTEHPFRERVHALLMTAPHFAGRTNDALRRPEAQEMRAWLGGLDKSQ